MHALCWKGMDNLPVTHSQIGRPFGMKVALPLILRIFVGFVLLLTTYFVDRAALVLSVTAYLIVGYDIIFRAIRGAILLKPKDYNLIVVVATICALIIGDYRSAALALLLLQIIQLMKKLFNAIVDDKLKQIGHGVPITADIRIPGEVTPMRLEVVKTGDTMVVGTDDTVPLDGVLLEGTAMVDESRLTGDKLPVWLPAGEEIRAGSVNIGDPIEVQVLRSVRSSTLNRIIEAVQEAAESVSEPDSMSRRFDAIYTTMAVAIAFIIAVAPPLFFDAELGLWLRRALVVLVAACPLATSISVPLTHFAGLVGSALSGVVHRTVAALDRSALVGITVLDQAASLSTGRLSIKELRALGIREEELIMLAAYALGLSDTPMARAVQDAYKPGVDISRITSSGRIEGALRATVGNLEIYAGNDEAMRSLRLTPYDEFDPNVLHISVSGRYVGFIRFEDTLRPEAPILISRLKSSGLDRIILLSEDSQAIAAKTAETLGIGEVVAECVSGDKINVLDKLLKETSANHFLAYVGNGIEDRRMLAEADIGVLVGSMGSEAAFESADIILVDKRIERLPLAIDRAMQVRRIINTNITISLVSKLLVLTAAAFGFIHIWSALVFDMLVTAITSANALRTLK